VIRAFRLGPQRLRPINDYLQQCRALERLPRLVLVDAYVQGAYGGTGSVADWDALQKIPTDELFPPMVLAGGLTPHNVAEAIRTVHPAAVDTASGVESSRGKKDPAAVEAFVPARAAFEDAGQGLP